MSLLQAMTASESELMRKLAGVYQQHGFTDAQAADDLLGVIGLFPEVADEIPGFQKAAGVFDKVLGAGAGMLNLGGKAVQKARPLLQSAKNELGNIRSAVTGTPQALRPAVRTPMPAVRPPAVPPVSAGGAGATAGGSTFNAGRATYQPNPARVGPTPGAVWNAAGGPQVLNAVKAAPAAAVNAAKAVPGMLGGAAGAVPGAVNNAVRATPSFIGNNWAGGLGGAATGGGIAMLQGENPIPGMVGGALMGMGGAGAAGGSRWAQGVGGAGGGMTAGFLANPVVAAGQQGIRQNIDPLFNTNMGAPLQPTPQDPSLAASADELGNAIGAGGNDLTRLARTTKSPAGQAQVGMQQREFADQALAKAQAEFPDRVPGTQDAIERAMPGMTDSVLGDLETIQAFKSPELTQQYVAKTDTLEQQLLSEIGSGAPDPAKHGPALAAIAKRRMAVAAKSAGATPAALAAKAQQIEANLNDGQLTPEDLKTVLSSTEGQKFLQEFTNSHAQEAANAQAGVPGTGVAGPAAPPYDATGALTALQNSRGSGTVGPVPAPNPTGGATTADPTASGGMDMGAIFSKIGEFAANNKAQFAALALGIPIALSGLAMTMSGGPSLGGILALILGGGLAAGGMGQFGGTDLMSPLQQFFGGGNAAPPPAPPAAAPDPRLGSPEFNLAAPEGGAAVSPAAPFPTPSISDTVNQPAAI
jgi:hypothetical protein